jgi:dethiobiotin synthetase
VRKKILFITGTDTDVGKTVLSLIVMRLLSGQDAVYLKPVQTGCRDAKIDSDAAFVHRHLPGGLPQGMTPADCIHSLRPLPKAPLFAGEPVDYDGLRRFVTDHAAHHDITVVEGAGGLMVPITEHKTMLDLALEIDASVLVASRAGLGTINHTLMTLETAREARGLGVILMDPADRVPDQDRAENKMAIERFSHLPVFGTIGRISDLTNPPFEALDVARKALAALGLTDCS